MAAKEVARAALKKVNVARKALDLRPLNRLPKGKKNCTARCPIANALDAVVGEDAVTFSSKKKASKVAKAWGTRVRVFDARTAMAPAEIQKFVDLFDTSKELDGYEFPGKNWND